MADPIGIIQGLKGEDSGSESSSKRTIKYRHILLIAFIAVIAFTIIIIIGLYYYYNWKEETVDFVGNNYNVAPRYPDKEAAAKILHTLDRDAIKIIDYLKTKYKNTRNSKIKEMISLLDRNYQTGVVSENDPEWKIGHKAVTVQGKRISLALRKNNGNFYDLSIIKFVFLHELSHVGTSMKYITKDNHHPDHFWAVFKTILTAAVDLGIINPEPYSPRYKVMYAGEEIIYNPYYNKALSL